MTRPQLHFILIVIIAIASAQILMAQSIDHHLVPLPERIVLNPGRLVIDGSFSIRFAGHTNALLEKAAARLMERLQTRTGIPLPPRSGTDSAVLQIQCGGPGESLQSYGADESYRLEVADGRATLAAAAPLGILRGMETFLQMIELGNRSFYIPAASIADRPRFPWRGLHMDVSRHWEPVAVILRNLDAMAAVKMNVFHWHLSDDQGFRMESLKFPKLHEKGSDGHYYTQVEVKTIIAYARDRGIRVVPEFDMPGHSTSWLVAYPELASMPGSYQIERAWGVFDPCMDPTRESTYAFLDAFIGEMAGLFPDEYFHIGGDEVNEKQWNASAAIRAFKTRHHMKDNRELQAYFNQRLLKILTKHGKKMMGWDEILHPDLPKNVVVQVWRKQPSIGDAVRRGFPGILSYGYYLDHMKPASFHYAMDPIGKDAGSLSPEERSRILGGEACMWAEFVNQDNIESRIWPRAAAVAERLWSVTAPEDIDNLYQRLDRLMQEFSFLGLRGQSNQLEMMQRLAGHQDIAPLKKLAQLLIPTGLSARLKTRKYTSLSPMNRMVDFVFPESETARQLDLSVRSFLADPAGCAAAAQKIQAALVDWKENSAQVRELLAQSYLLLEVEPLSDTVAELCAKGLQAIDYLQSRQEAPETWRRETQDLLDRSDKPQAEMLPAIAGSIRKLFEAAAAENAAKNGGQGK